MKNASKLLSTVAALGLVFGAASFSASAATETVEEGDTLWGIAQQHEGVSVNELLELNSDLDPRAIPVGTEIQLDANNEQEDVVTHVVQPGNTYYEIASVYDGVTVDNLFELNPEVDPYALPIGSEVVVVDRASDVIYHTVQPGNTFYEIASVYDGVSVEDIMAANPNVDTFMLEVGSKIAIPLN